jgi:hypothetical protein
LFWGEEEKRTKPNKALKKMVYVRDKGICRMCNEKVDLFSFEIGHDVAHSKGGKLNLQNAILLCSLCNKSMRTMTLKQARKALGLPEPTSAQDEAKKALDRLTMRELKYLAKNRRIKIKGKVSEGMFTTTTLAPSKQQYVTALSKEINKDQITNELSKLPKPERKKKKKKRSSNSFSFFS